MANCNKLFNDFVKKVTPSADQMQTMKNSRKKLEDKIREFIKNKLELLVCFYTQGSGSPKMKTLIIKADGTYDADRGVYIQGDPELTPETVQGYVYDAVKDHTDDGAEHRKKCIRVLYKSAYNIDFPVYYETKGEALSYLAVKGNGWIKDDPAKMIEWFCELKVDCGQLLKMVKCLKAWASETSHKMPSGIALTVWAAKSFVAVEDRDDKCLLELLKAIKNSILFSVACLSPVEPYDDLVAKLTDAQKEKFREALDSFIADAELAINENNQLAASKLWIKHLGTRFPEGLDEDVDKRSAALFATAAMVLSENAKLDRSGNINTSVGVEHKPHRNYGG
jgi:hypothetical protein